MPERPKTEKEKMLANELYRASDPELAAESQYAFHLTRLYNGEAAENLEQRSELLKQLLGRVGKNPFIVPPFHCDYGRNIYIGDNFYMNYGGVILDCNLVHIGDNVLCAPYVQIDTAYHPVDPAVRLTGLELAAPITIGNNVWIGGGAIICPGVTIADNVTIGAGSVVTKDIPANVVAVGNPCKVLRTLE
jgi:maltose O-acetyltransferase